MYGVSEIEISRPPLFFPRFFFNPLSWFIRGRHARELHARRQSHAKPPLRQSDVATIISWVREATANPSEIHKAEACAPSYVKPNAGQTTYSLSQIPAFKTFLLIQLFRRWLLMSFISTFVFGHYCYCIYYSIDSTSEELYSLEIKLLLLYYRPTRSYDVFYGSGHHDHTNNLSFSHAWNKFRFVCFVVWLDRILKKMISSMVREFWNFCGTSRLRIE